jgi:hypothetical protein
LLGDTNQLIPNLHTGKQIYKAIAEASVSKLHPSPMSQKGYNHKNQL